MKKIFFFPILALLLAAMVSCEKDNPAPFSNANDSVDFRNREYLEVNGDFTACLGVHTIYVDGVNYTGFGALPSYGWMVGQYTGTWASVTTEDPRQSGNGTTHYILKHKFSIDEDNYFHTEDKAVCSSAKGLEIACLINDQMTIVGGKGIFENASGKIKTQGPILPPTAECPVGNIQLYLKGKVYLN